MAEVEYTSSLSRQGAEGAIRSLQKLLNIRRQLNDPASTQADRLLPFIDSAAKLCARSTFVGKMAVARDSCTEALDLAQQWLKNSPKDKSAKIAAQEALLQNTLLLEADGKAEEARQSIVRSFDLATGLSRDEPGNPELLGKLARAARVYAELLLTIKQPQAAIEPAEISVKTSQALLGLDPRNVTWRVDAAGSLLAAGSAHRQASLEKGPKEVHLARAAALLEDALEINRQTAQLDPLSSSAQDSVIVTSHRLARGRENQHRYEDALTLYRDARELIQRRVDRDPTRRNLYLMGNNLLSAASVQLLAGNRAEAAQTYRSSASWLLKTLAKEPSDAVARENLIGVYFSQAQMAEQDHNQTLARDRWTMAWTEAQRMVQRDASAKSYLTDYQALEEMGRRLGELKADQ